MLKIKNWVLAIILTTCTSVYADDVLKAPNTSIKFVQNGSFIKMVSEDDAPYEVNMISGYFEIRSPADMTQVCAWKDESIFEKVSADTDIMKDFGSCMFIYKSMAMGKDADYLILSKGNAQSLNEVHGTKKISDEEYAHTVTHFLVEGKPMSKQSIGEPVYMVVWIDGNKDKIVDEDEFDRLIIKFTK